MPQTLMSKGQKTKQIILQHAAARASILGLNGLSIGQLAQELNMSKSGLFGHFSSKKTLQIEVLETIAEQFRNEVIRPALKKPRGPERLRALFDNWLRWAATTNAERNGCPFFAASTELDDREGAVREKLVVILQQWLEVLETTLRLGQESEVFGQNLDTRARAQELYGLMLGFHSFFRLFKDTEAEARARQLFEEYLLRLKN